MTASAMITEMELVLLALDNYRNRRIISYREQSRIFVFYVTQIRKRKMSVELYLSYLKPEIESWCCGADISDSEKKHLLRKVKEYLCQAEKRADKRAGKL